MENDDRPARSRFLFDPAQGTVELEVRSLNYGAGTVRLGELILRVAMNRTPLGASLRHVTYGDDVDDDDYGL